MAKPSLSILVALHGGGLSGVDTYAEQVASAAASQGHTVTLLAVGPTAAEELRVRLEETGGGVVATAAFRHPRWRRLARQVPTTALVELRELTTSALGATGAHFDVAHLNHPALAPAARPFAARVAAGAWFYPHRPLARAAETWRHTGGLFPRSGALAAKSMAHYLNDRYGYRRCDIVVAPTERLAAELRSMRITAVAVPPPAAAPAEIVIDRVARERGACRLMICCGDLAHPRKNVRAGIAAVGLLAGGGRPLELVLVGGNADRLEGALRSLPASVKVRAPGTLARPVIQRWMADSDALLVPSLYEEWGYVATEAMIIGTPVAAFPVYPFDEVLVPPLGVAATEMTAQSLAHAIRTAIETGADRGAVRDAAVARLGAAEVSRRLQAAWTASPNGVAEPAQAGASGVPS